MYCITSSRRWCSKSTSMSGGSLHSLLMKRSNSIDIREGSCERDDVVDGEEVGLVAQLGNQREFVLDQSADLRWDACVAISLREPGFSERAQVRRGSRARRHDFVGVLVAQLVERKTAAAGNRRGLGEQRRRI